MKPVRARPQIRFLRMLMRLHARVIENQARELRNGLGMGLSEFDMIAALGNTGGLRMRELATAMITSPANVTRVAMALEKRGFVVRARSAESQREVVARLTPEGEKVFDTVFLKVADFTTQTVDHILVEDDQVAVCDLMEKALNNLLAAEGLPELEQVDVDALGRIDTDADTDTGAGADTEPRATEPASR